MGVVENLDLIQKQIARAAQAAGRSNAEVQLVAVSKVQPEERIEEALAAGQRLFGENRVQEAQQRWGSFSEGRRVGYADLKLHLIGPLQTNKAADAVALFDVIETVDREKLARILAKEMKKQERHLPCFIQVNTGDEPQKAGVSVADLPAFLEFCRDECGLNIIGLMCIPPFDEDPAAHFELLRTQAHALGLKELSMGMSGDYEQAIGAGATYVRVGTGVFGSRDY